MYVVQKNAGGSYDTSLLNYAKGHHHTIWENDAMVDSQVWFHGLETYNIAVDVESGVARVELSGTYQRFWNHRRAYSAELETTKTYNIGMKTLWSPPYVFLDGSEDRPPAADRTGPAEYRYASGNILLEAGDYALTAVPYAADGTKGDTLTVSVEIRANAQTTPIFDEQLVLNAALWKDVYAWQSSLPAGHADKLKKIDGGDRADWSWSKRVIATFFKNYVYIVHERWGTVYRVKDDDDTGPTLGMSLFLDVQHALRAVGFYFSTVPNWHSGLRGIALHPSGDDWNGFAYVSLMEERKAGEPAHEYLYLDKQSTWTPISSESVLAEFKYVNGLAVESSYRPLLRVECPVLDHTIRQVAFDTAGFLYALHGDGSVESAIVGEPQLDDGLGKILRLDPRNKRGFGETLAWGEYSTEGNPYDQRQSPGPAVPPPASGSWNPSSPLAGLVPKETWSIGHRNPHTMTFTNDGTFIVGEAGRDTFEEINVIVPGGNYGWSYYEGDWFHTKLKDQQTKAYFYSAHAIGPGEECSQCNFRWPQVAVGHVGFEGMKFSGAALAGGHVVENGSPVHTHGRGTGAGGKYFYCNFPRDGKCFYSYFNDLKASTTTASGAAASHWQATQYDVRFQFGGKVFENFRGVMGEIHPDIKNAIAGDSRIEVRIGRNQHNQMLITSKTTGEVYKITNS